MQNNNLPDGWKIVKLKDYTTERKQKNKANEELTVFSISNKRGFVKSDDYFEGQVYSKDLKNYKIVKKGDFAYNPARINVGSIAYLESEEIGLLSPMYVIFSLNKEIDKDYFSYFIKGNLFNKQVNNFTQGAVRQILSFGDLGNISLLLPPLEVQKEIAGKLNDLDKLIQTQNNQIEKYEKLKKAMMKELFVKGVGNKTFIDDKYLGKIPSGWDVKKIVDICSNIQYGFTDSAKSDGNMRFIRITDIDFDTGISYETLPYCNVPEKEIDKYKLNKGDILFARTGATTGKTAFFDIDDNDIVFASYLIRLVINNKLINNKYVFLFLNSYYYWHQINLMNNGSAQGGVNANSLGLVRIPIPKIEEQKKIADILENIDNLLEKEREIKELYEKVKKGIVSLVFSCNLLIK